MKGSPMKNALIAASALVLAAACVSAPAYREARQAGEAGYSSQIIEKDRFTVNYTGNSRQSASDVQNLALLRAAELTMENGGDWFEIVNDVTTEDIDVKQRLADSGFDTRTEFRRECGLLGCTTGAYPVTVEKSDLVTDAKVVYGHSMEIIVYQGTKPRDNGRAYNAAETAANLRSALN